MPGTNTIECPHCGASNVILAGAANKRWMCDVCGGLIDLRGTDGAPPPADEAGQAPPPRARASRWMEGLTPEQQAAIRAEMTADPDILRKELGRVRRETTAKLMGVGAASPLLRLIGGVLVLAGVVIALQPFAGRLFERLGDTLPMAVPMSGLMNLSSPVALLLGLGMAVSGGALAIGRRWGAPASALFLVFACVAFGFHPAVFYFTLVAIAVLYLTRKSTQ